ncbi:MAG: hypothetical protein AAGA15_04085 [Pseudomonadota bacterium]
MRRLLVSFLAALILVTGVGLGHARGVMPAEGAVVICHGHSTAVIWIDADGQEVEQHILCPEAALGFLADTATGAPVATPAELAVLDFVERRVGMRLGLLREGPFPRGPPFPV